MFLTRYLLPKHKVMFFFLKLVDNLCQLRSAGMKENSFGFTDNNDIFLTVKVKRKHLWIKYLSNILPGDPGKGSRSTVNMIRIKIILLWELISGHVKLAFNRLSRLFVFS